MSLYLKGNSKAALSVSFLASQSSCLKVRAGPSCQLQNGAINRKAGSLVCFRDLFCVPAPACCRFSQAGARVYSKAAVSSISERSGA